MFDEKTAERKLFDEIYHKPKEERKAMGLDSWEKIYKHCGISISLGQKLKNRLDNKGKLEPTKPTFRDELSSIENVTMLKDALKNAIKLNKVKAIETYLKLIGELDRKEEKKVEFTPNDRIRFAEQLREFLIRGFQDTGNCPVCGKSGVLVEKLCVDIEREQEKEGQVAAVELFDTPCPIIPGGTRNSNFKGEAVGDKSVGDGLSSLDSPVPL